MTRQPVRSTNLRSVGYEDGTLEVEFLNRTVYQYFNVPFEIYVRLVSYPHPGTYFADAVKGIYDYRQIY